MELIQGQNGITTLTSREKSNSLLIHLSSLSHYLFPFAFISILMPLILWQTMKNDSRFIDHHGKEAVNFNLSFLLYQLLIIFLLAGSVIGVVLSGMAVDSGSSEEILSILFSSTGVIIAIVLIGLFSILKIVFIILAAIKANNGELYRYPMTIRFIRGEKNE